jgi:hypothetical protein
VSVTGCDRGVRVGAWGCCTLVILKDKGPGRTGVWLQNIGWYYWVVELWIFPECSPECTSECSREGGLSYMLGLQSRGFVVANRTQCCAVNPCCIIAEAAS